MNAWIFDVDGVITDPVTKIADAKVLKYISKILDQGDFVALNTGRSFSWINDALLSHLSKVVLNKDHFKNFFVVCEKGNVLSRLEGETWTKQILDDPLPESLQKEIQAIVKNDFSDCMFFDESKETMISVEMKDGFNIALYSQRQAALKSQVKKILIEKFNDFELIIDPSQISLDIQYEDAGKHLGAERIDDFMMEKGIKPETVYMFGDSASDVQMAQELEEHHKVLFVFVNDKSKLTNTPMCEVIYTQEKFTKGTLEYLENSGDIITS